MYIYMCICIHTYKNKGTYLCKLACKCFSMQSPPPMQLSKSPRNAIMYLLLSPAIAHTCACLHLTFRY